MKNETPEVTCEIHSANGFGFPYGWLHEQGLCPTCVADEARRYAPEHVASQEAYISKIVGLPPLDGTADEIALAEHIRLHALASIDNRLIYVDNALFRSSRLGTGTDEAFQDLWNRVRAARTELEEQSSTAWWINNQRDVYAYVWNALLEGYADKIAERKRRRRRTGHPYAPHDAARAAKAKARQRAEVNRLLRQEIAEPNRSQSGARS